MGVLTPVAIPTPLGCCRHCGGELGSADFITECRVCVERQELARRRRAMTFAIRELLSELPELSPAERAVRMDRRLHACADRYAPGDGSLLIIGPSGAGKTTLLRCIGRRLLADAWRVGDEHHAICQAVWTSGLELAKSRRETRLGAPDELLAAAERAPLLFLDEIGQESGEASWLLALLEPRYSKRVTLATSGLTREQLDARYGSGAVRRLFEPRGLIIDLFEGA